MSVTPPTPPSSHAGSENAQIAFIEVEGMTCGHCAATVQKALMSTAGVKRATVDATKKEAEVAFDSGAVTIAALMQVVNRTGFTAVGFVRGSASR